MTNINVPELEQEYLELIKAKNAWFHHQNIDPAYFQTVRDSQTDDLKDDLGRMDSVPDMIDYLKSSRTYNYGEGYGKPDVIQSWMNQDKPSTNTIGRHAADHLSLIARRMSAIRLLVDTYDKFDEGDVKDSQAVRDAARTWRRIETSIGWKNSIQFDIGTPGEMLDYTETPSPYGQGVCWNMKIGVNRNWIDVVAANQIQRVDIAQKDYMTLWAEEIPEHELKDQNVRLFQAKIMATRVPRTMSTYSPRPGQGKEIVLLEDRVIAVQTFVSGGRTVTTGKDQSWAIRTMKGRMKKQMMRQMGL